MPGAVDAFAASPPTGAGSASPPASPRRSTTPRPGCRSRPHRARLGASAATLTGEARRFFLLDGAAPAPGQIFRAPGQAEVLRRIARDGRAGFYEGEVAEDMVASLRALGGAHTLDDFAATACAYVEPIAGDYRGHELVELPPNGQGATAILMAKILAHFDLAASTRSAPRGRISRPRRPSSPTTPATASSPTRRRAAPARHMLADGPPRGSPALIDPDRALPDPAEAGGGDPPRHRLSLRRRPRPDGGVDDLLDLSGFGSGLASSRFGINFQNRGAGFC